MKLYAAIDLHSNNNVLVILDEQDRIVYEKRLSNELLVILEQLADGEAWDSLLKGYPELTRADIQAALRYARQSILHTEITALEPA